VVERKLFRTGNSLTVTIPPAVASELGLKAGDLVELEVDREHEGLLVRQKEQAEPKTAPITPEFLAWVDGFIGRYEEALRQLGEQP
jgi:antitoxin component of MazEF toxin-antitoxin module